LNAVLKSAEKVLNVDSVTNNDEDSIDILLETAINKVECYNLNEML
jgi:hypothetical protein